MFEDYIKYDQLIDKAMRTVIREALLKAEKDGLKGDHHFLITFITTHEGVSISKRLRSQYPNEMTIVLQHQFEDLKVGDSSFEITLSFNGKRDRLVVPFTSINSFADPSIEGLDDYK